MNVLAVRPSLRGRGLGGRLLDLADATARALGKRALAVIVSDANGGARRLYERRGYRLRAARAMVKEDWENDGTAWLLLAKETQQDILTRRSS